MRFSCCVKRYLPTVVAAGRRCAAIFIRPIRFSSPFSFQIFDILALVTMLSFTMGTTIRLNREAMKPPDALSAPLTSLVALYSLAWVIHVVSLNYRDENRPWVRMCGYVVMSSPITILWSVSIFSLRTI